MKQELIQELALIYVKTHTNAETTVDEVYGLYKKAAKELQKLDLIIMCPLRISVFKFFTQRHWLPPVALSFFTEICVSSIPQSKTIHSSPVFSFTSFRSTSFVFGDNSPGADKTIISSPPLRPRPGRGCFVVRLLKEFINSTVE